MKNKIVLLFITATLAMVKVCPGENKGANLFSDNTGAKNDTTETVNIMAADNKMNIKIGAKELTVTLADNSSVDALKAALEKGPITVNMKDYGSMEKVGSLGRDFPRNDERITTEAGDVILYQGSALVIYYAPNTWSFTRLGKIDNVSKEELKAILGGSSVTVTLSLPQN